uniref:Uncharacterized protein n=1 Tax=Anguilla anguilla TaxID=7936 RepID=A0A0E9S7P2_ANGAN
MQWVCTLTMRKTSAFLRKVIWPSRSFIAILTDI